jgi:membrane fusion protein (multidrug efflux system)
MKRLFRYTSIGIVAVALILGGIWYWYERKYHPSTDDAYVGAHTVRIAPQVSGRVVEMAVSNHERVHEGQLLYVIDPTVYRLDVAQAEAKLALARQQVVQLQAGVTAASAQVNQAKVELSNAESNSECQNDLVKCGFTDNQAEQDAEATAAEQQAALSVAEDQRARARAELGSLGADNHQVKLAQAVLGIAEQNLRHTRVVAPCDGQLSGLQLRPGDYVTLGQANFVLVCETHWWVDANFKETDLARIQVGQRATVTVDMYPGHSFRARVASINPASGAAFSLLPPENATGNWVKVTQRVPVRVEILDPSPDYPLRVGTSAEARIDTRGSGGPAPRAQAIR